MKTKKAKIIIVIICIAMIICMISLSVDATLRTVIFFYSPKSAVSMEYEKLKDIDDTKTLYRITENSPMEKATQNELYTWVVYSFGPFHFAKYYGEG
ncbi:hypothetical protein LI177_10390 [bacterium 210820-DFI.6.37]|nr:hypothetical protein [bacterium 210820-DFI.6.37]